MTHLAFGIESASAYFGRIMAKVLGGLDQVLCYINDILIFSKTFEDHLRAIEMVLRRLIQFNLKASPKKCVFAKQQLIFLGHRISHFDYAPSAANLKPIQDDTRQGRQLSRKSTDF